MVIAFGAGAIAKLASAFVLVKLALVNLAVIVLRSAKISSYTPTLELLYPFTQILGIGISLYLIVKLGSFPLILVCAATLLTLIGITS